MSPEDSGEFGRYCQLRNRGEDEVCARLRMRLDESTAARFEADLRKLRAGSDSA